MLRFKQGVRLKLSARNQISPNFMDQFKLANGRKDKLDYGIFIISC